MLSDVVACDIYDATQSSPKAPVGLTEPFSAIRSRRVLSVLRKRFAYNEHDSTVVSRSFEVCAANDDAVCGYFINTGDVRHARSKDGDDVRCGMIPGPLERRAVAAIGYLALRLSDNHYHPRTYRPSASWSYPKATRKRTRRRERPV